MIVRELKLLIPFCIFSLTYNQEPNDWPWNHAQKGHTGVMGNVDLKTELATVVFRDDEVYQRNQWGRDDKDGVARLWGKPRDKIRVGCHMYHKDNNKNLNSGGTQVTIRDVKNQTLKNKTSCITTLQCWHSFILTEPVFVVCLGRAGRASKEIALTYKVKIDIDKLQASDSPTTTETRTTILPETRITQPITPDPQIIKIGPYAIRNTGQQQMLSNPNWSLKRVELLMKINISEIQPACSPFLKTSFEGWTTWLRKQVPFRGRTQRDLTGVLGTGLGILNGIDSEIIMNKLATATGDLTKLQQPLQSSLSALGANQWLLSKVLPKWEEIEEQDHKFIIDALGVAQDNVSLALSCTQAQLWMQSVAASIIREGEQGIFPTEIRKIVWDSATDFERDLQSWWTLVNFTYDPITSTATTFVLTIYNASLYVIHPIIALGLNHNGTLLYPSEHRVWARMVNGKWQTVNLESCITREQQGFICEGDTIDDQDICLDTEQNICHFEVHPDNNQKTMLVYTGHGCVCLRTTCDSLTIDNRVVHNEYHSNLCICNFTKIVGCDFSYQAPVISHQLIKSNYTLFHHLSPVPIGMNLSLVKQLVSHPDLIRILQDVKENGQKTLITVHHDTEEIHKILKRAKEDAAHNWWDALFGWSPTATGIFNKLRHPVVILLTLVLISLVFSVILFVWNWRMLQRLTSLTFLLQAHDNALRRDFRAQYFPVPLRKAH